MVGPGKGEQLFRARNKLNPGETREERAGLAATVETGTAGQALVGRAERRLITKPWLSASPQPAQGTHTQGRRETRAA